jgi:hypothetical protein
MALPVEKHSLTCASTSIQICVIGPGASTPLGRVDLDM